MKCLYEPRARTAYPSRAADPRAFVLDIPSHISYYMKSIL